MQGRMLFLFKHAGMALSQNSFQHFTGSPSDWSGKMLFAMCGWGMLVAAPVHTNSAASHSTPQICHANTSQGAPGGNPISCSLRMGTLVLDYCRK